LKTCVVISSVNRPQVLHEAVLSLRKQTISPNAIILSLCDTASVLRETSELPFVLVIQGPRGLTKQRNNGARVAPFGAEYLLFLDDDTELALNYLESMEKLFDHQKEIVVASGVSAADGLRLGRALARDEAAAATRGHRSESRTEPAEGAYGCNMFVRRSVLATVGFDEQLPLDGWLEDYDFSVRSKQYGLVVWNHETCVAHLGLQRTTDERGFLVGYSQIANSYYLWQKEVIPSLRRLLSAFWFPALRVSLQGTLHGKPPWNLMFDYKGRLRGNAYALADAARFRLAPSRILSLAERENGSSNKL
jgi:GT2 family glycosyltransferase